MVEVPGSENQLLEIIRTVCERYRGGNYRKTMDSNGDDYFLILNLKGEEVAEWDEADNTWHLLSPPLPTGDIQNCTCILSLSARIQQQRLLMIMCQGKLSRHVKTGPRKKGGGRL
jgi:hypothetical protein